jgi:hypothetical protein
MASKKPSKSKSSKKPKTFQLTDDPKAPGRVLAIDTAVASPVVKKAFTAALHAFSHSIGRNAESTDAELELADRASLEAKRLEREARVG